METINSSSALRTIDANLNRFREGIRVAEDLLRYHFNDKKLALELKNLRHITISLPYQHLLSTRNSLDDVLKNSIKSEQVRKDFSSLFIANFKRAQESARVLEEILKTSDIEASETFKKARYTLYWLEKKTILTYFSN